MGDYSYYVTADIEKKISDVKKSWYGYHYYYEGNGYAIIAEKEQPDLPGYKTYTHSLPSSYYGFKSVRYRGSDISELLPTVLSSRQVVVYYSSTDTNNDNPLFLDLGKNNYKKGENTWESVGATTVTLNELDKLNYGRRNEVILRLDKSGNYGPVKLISNTEDIPGYTKRTYSLSYKTFKVSSVYRSSTKLKEIVPVSNVSSVNAYFEAPGTIPILLEFVQTGSSCNYYSATDGNGENWANDASSHLDNDAIRERLYSFTYRFKNILVLDPITSTTIGEISVKNGTINPGGYTKHYYSKSGSFTVSSVSYKSTKLTIDISKDTVITKIITYFTKNDDKLLCVYIHRKESCIYYINPNIDSPIGPSTYFEEFMTANKTILDENYLSTVLKNVEDNKSINYRVLPGDIREKFLRSNDVFFDLRKTSGTTSSSGKKYFSDFTAMEVNLTDRKVGQYPKVQHYPTNHPFYIKGIKDPNGKDIKVEGGFPNDPLNEFNVYYKDDNYKDPLLVELKVNLGTGSTGYIPEKYLISKNGEKTEWDIIRIAGTWMGDNDLKAILDNIVENDKLEVEKLGDSVKNKFKDITKNLIINLNASFTSETGMYSSEGQSIHYKVEKSTGYTVVQHASKFPTFTVTKIETSSGDITYPTFLPPPDTLINNLKIYYKGTDTKDPLLIYLSYGHERKWLKKHIGDTTWTPLNNNILSRREDSGEIQKVLKQCSIPNVEIDLSKPADHSYTPVGTSLSFRVTRSPIQKSSYVEFKHTKDPRGEFTLKQVKNGGTLSDISSEATLSSVSAFYSGNTPAGNKLLMVQLEKSDGSSNGQYEYYKRTDKSGSNWTKDLTQTSKLQDIGLIAQLSKLTGVLPDVSLSSQLNLIWQISTPLASTGLVGVAGWKFGPTLRALL